MGELPVVCPAQYFDQEVRDMKLEKLVGERFKERPSDCVIDSHALMLRGGYMK